MLLSCAILTNILRVPILIYPKIGNNSADFYDSDLR
nr:MAG TPA: hypothetical protein [Caudoviricetes sp.]